MPVDFGIRDWPKNPVKSDVEISSLFPHWRTSSYVNCSKTCFTFEPGSLVELPVNSCENLNVDRLNCFNVIVPGSREFKG